MTLSAPALICTLLVNSSLGVLLHLTNSSRRQNRYFLFFSLVLSLWNASVLGAVFSTTGWIAEGLIRLASISAALVAVAFHFLCIVIRDNTLTLASVLRRARWTVMLWFAVSLLCLTPWFIRGVLMPGEDDAVRTVADAVYGPGFPLYVAYFFVVFGIIIGSFARNLRTATGIQRTELQFVILGSVIMVPMGIVINLIPPLITGSSQTQQYGPLSIILMNFVIAYGIATRRIMGVAEVLRRALAYALLTAYLLALYLAVWQGTGWVLRAMAPGALPVLPSLLAALAVAFSMAPASGWMQRLSNLLFIRARAMDVPDALQKAGHILQTVTTVKDLLERFADLIVGTTGAGQVTILLRERTGFVRHYPPSAAGAAAFVLPAADPVVEALAGQEEPLVEYVIERRRPTPLLSRARQGLRALDAPVVIGVFSKRELRGLVAVGRKQSGRLYDRAEQDALQMLCNQLAVALDNARLYTALQDEKIYGEILLDNLVSGVAAVNEEGLVTVFNHEAQRIAQRPAAQIIGQPMDQLPGLLRSMLETTLHHGKGLRDLDGELPGPADGTVAVRLGTSLVRGHEGRVLGALVVFNDLSAIKRLEDQVRRTDRLASMGTLVAGMAHEIKNPLVTIKTFAQLLPERFDDADFRSSYAQLVGEEVERIDSIVNQLLHFTRPRAPTLAPIRLHAVLDASLRLVEQPARQKGIELRRDYAAPDDRIRGDVSLLTQAFVNFYLNGVDAMRPGGALTVRTRETVRWSADRNLWGEPVQSPCLQVRIEDVGRGILPEHVSRIFDPFFTTKDNGTGLGLSVAHGILTEHGGQIEVESKVDSGTAFVLSFPISRDEVSA